jgi:menaquinol-cytochrome c reductase iron-sulfur subunit
MDIASQQIITENAPRQGRRTFLRWLSAILGTIAAVVLSVPVLGYFFGLRKRSVFWVDLGAVTAFPINQTRRINFDNPLRQPWDGVTALTGVYVRYEGKNNEGADQFRVLSVNCAHLGCPVTWFPQSGLFMCPCHGGVYYADGERASGPPPRGLFHCVWRIQDGKLQVQAPHYPTLQDTLTASARSCKEDTADV